MKKFGGEATAGVFDYGGFITWIWAHDDMSGALYTGKKTPGPLAVGGRLSTGHLSFLRSMRQRLPRSMPGQQTGTDGRGPPPRSGHKRQSSSRYPCFVPSGSRLGFRQYSLRGSREVGVLLAQAASSSAQRQWRSLGARPPGARSMLDARSFMISTLRSQVGFAAAVAHARLRLSRLELIGGSGRSAGSYASAARAFISPTAFEQARGGALGAGGGRVGFAGGGLF